MPPSPKFWLLKTEPETYSLAELRKDKRTHWDGVRNFQARNFLRQIAIGDVALIYHSGDEKAVVGIAHVTRAAYPDPDPEKPGEWVQIDLKFSRELATPVRLQTLKTNARLRTLPLIKQSRLSVMPITPAHFETLVELGTGQ